MKTDTTLNMKGLEGIALIPQNELNAMSVNHCNTITYAKFMSNVPASSCQ